MTRPVSVLLTLVALSPLPARAAVLSAEDLAAARAVKPGEGYAVELPLGGKDRRLELERFVVFEPGAEVLIHGEGGRVERQPAPDHAYFRGTVSGEPGTRAFLVVRESGEVRALVTSTRGVSLYAREVEGSERSRELSSVELALGGPSFECGTEGHTAALADLLPATGEPAPPPVPLGAVSHSARVAIETDFEYLGLFGGDTTAATAYAGDLIGFASTIYDNETGTNLVIPSVSLWSTASDPWAQPSAGCGLYEFGKYWNDNRGGVTRTIAHFLSGKTANSGVAWIGVLCAGGFNYTISGCSGMAATSNYGGAYGFTGGIDGNFNPDNPTVLWDIVAVAHEIGHNFNSPHTHCYVNIGGNANPVDNCYAGQCGQNGCYCGSTSLPGGAGSGTIMSYCHLLSGGLGNLSLNFGTGHPFGVVPQRVPDRMRAHVVSQAAGNASCLARVENSLIFEDGFDAGGTTGWDAVTP